MGENASLVTEPLRFYNAFGGCPDQADSSPPLDHAMGVFFSKRHRQLSFFSPL
jgi:hypothetical protein